MQYPDTMQQPGAPGGAPGPRLPVVFVAGRSQVDSYQMAPDTNVLFLSTEDDRAWLATCDGAGNRARTRTYHMVEDEEPESDGLATRADLAGIDGKLDELIGALR